MVITNEKVDQEKPGQIKAEDPALSKYSPTFLTKNNSGEIEDNAKTHRFNINYKALFFFSSLLLLIFLVNSGWLKTFLDTLVGTSWSDPLVTFLKNNTQGFIILFLVSFYFEYIKGDKRKMERLEERALSVQQSLAETQKQIKDIHTFLDDNYWKRVDVDSAMENLLANHYGPDSDVANLISTVLSDKPFYTNAFLSITLSDCVNDPDCYEAYYELRFSAKMKEFVIAFVENTIIQDQILMICPEMNEVYVVDDPAHRNESVERVLRGEHEFKYTKPSSIKGSISTEKMAFHSIDKKKYSSYLRDLPKGFFDKISLLAYSLPKDYIEIESVYRIRLKKSEHFYYWVSDRPIFIKHIKIDTSRLSVRPGAEIQLHPFIENCYLSDDENPSPKVYSINVNNWVVKGQSIAISW